MKAQELVGATFEHPSIDMGKIHKWEVTKVDDRTDYVYVERPDGANKIGQWIPGEWVLEFMEPKRLRLKIDALRKSRDYFKNERDELNRRIVSVSVNHETESTAMLQEIEFLRMEMDSAEKDLRFWKVFSVCVAGASLVLGASLLAARVLFC